MNSIWQDVTFGFRMLKKHRVASVVCIVALALGIGANAAIFSMAEAFLIHPVPFEQSDRFMALLNRHTQESGVGFGSQDYVAVAPATFFDWKKEAKSFDSITAYAWDEVNLTGDREPQKVQSFQVAANFFDTIGVSPAMGRAFLAEEEEIGKNQSIILGHALWEQRYGSNPNILGKNIKVDGKSYTVVGVMAKGFDYPMPAEAWIPLAFDTKERGRRDNRWLWVLGRLAPGVSVAEGKAEMQAIAQRESEAYPDTNRGFALVPMPLADYMTGNLTRQYMALLLGSVAFVLLIACANVANVQFARVTGRVSEFAIRTALGGSRWRVVRQLLIESILLSIGGAALGLLIAQWNIDMIVSHMPPDVAKYVAGWKTIRLDTNAFLFAIGVSLASGILSGIAPSLLSSRTNVTGTLKEGGRGATMSRGRHRLRGALVVAEVTLALVLLVGAGLLVRSFQGLLNVNENYSPATLLTMNMSLPDTQYATPAARLNFQEQVQRRIATIPGIQASALATHVPYADGGGIGTDDFTIEGRPLTRREDSREAILETASASYFGVMNIALRDGRFLTDADGADSPKVAVVSASLVRKYFNGENPIGHRIKVGKANSEKPWMTVVGVVSDLHYSWINKEDTPTLYRSYRQAPPGYTTLAMRTNGDPLKFAATVRGEIANIDPNLPMYNIKSMDKVITESIVGIAYVAVMMTVLGAIALVLASVGIFGVMSYSVSERTHEIGIRMSQGAQTRDILSLVLRGGMGMTLLGLAIGLPISFVLARTMSAILFNVQSADPIAFLALPLLLASVAALACYLPARRAAGLDPLRALRHE
ncbi:MAG: ABC transporter permease [Candidatus Acidiferrum sp.]